MDSNTQLAVIGYPFSSNLGDEVQSIAAARLLPRVDRYLPRERLDEANGDQPIKLLCNGFFLHQPDHWPPADNVKPLIVSFHVTGENGAKEALIRPELKEYYDRFAPIGCRDKRTERLFKSIGVDAYYSGCVTLTLENKFPESERTDEILLVDPFYKYQSEDYRTYLEESIIPAEFKGHVHRITHALPADHGMTEQEKIAAAEALLERYAKAKLVITSRIHCALPCLALGTPVHFVTTGYDRKHGMERFEGLLQYFHTVNQEHFPLVSRKPFFKILRALRLHRLFVVKPLGINFAQPAPNKEVHLPYAAAIRKRVQEWLLD